ncbi:succinate--hydroxymethylglutarate CoA-transferase-like [Polyodon spathula]|uniref:succinate--hydroxymethylglutarate CoA-transferase-like n=1 Tax=Polyodon spathula TaxID=7913 RepID=UPI001B7F1B1A|nr:succinate--hydroxymethylglutarate CoA-transferase-like [Polyodon spathula]
MILGDLGDLVIKVERPGVGDDIRTWGPPFVGKESAYFLSVNCNKKSTAVILKDPKGANIIKEVACLTHRSEAKRWGTAHESIIP